MRSRLFITTVFSAALLLGGCSTNDQLTGVGGKEISSPRVTEGRPSTATTVEAPIRGIVGSGTESYVLNSGTATYKVEYNGVLSTWTVKHLDDKVVHSNDQGEVITKIKDAWGNTTEQTGSSGNEVFDPDNGFYPKEPMRDGLSWEQRYLYKVDGEPHWWWRRNCSVTWRGEVEVTAGFFQDAWRIECNAVREADDLKYKSLLLIAERGRVVLGYSFQSNHKSGVRVSSQELMTVSGEQISTLHRQNTKPAVGM